LGNPASFDGAPGLTKVTGTVPRRGTLPAQRDVRREKLPFEKDSFTMRSFR
jgi:hypothetical protein